MSNYEDRNTDPNVAGTPGSDSNNQASQNMAASGSGHQGTGHASVLNPAASECEFLGLKSQKNAAESNAVRQMEDAGGILDEDVKRGALDETCNTEDHSFMGHKPGCPDTLMGSSLLKGAIERMTK